MPLNVGVWKEDAEGDSPGSWLVRGIRVPPILLAIQLWSYAQKVYSGLGSVGETQWASGGTLNHGDLFGERDWRLVQSNAHVNRETGYRLVVHGECSAEGNWSPVQLCENLPIQDPSKWESG